MMKGMDCTVCHVILCDRRAETDLLVTRQAFGSSFKAPNGVRENVRVILAAFQEVYLCRSGVTCSERLHQLEDARHQGIPVIIFFDIDPEIDFKHRLSRDTSLLNPDDISGDEYYGITLLEHLVVDAHTDGFGKLMIPIAVIRDGRRFSSQSAGEDSYVFELRETLRANLEAADSLQLVEPRVLMKCLDAGAADAFNSPLTSDRMQQVIVSAYKSRLQHAKEKPRQLDLKKLRKRSWVGVEDERPYSYLREAMVSSLMSSICRPEMTALGINIDTSVFDIEPKTKRRVADAVGSWKFSAHEFSDDELLYGAYLIFSHCLQMPELEKLRLSKANLQRFLIASRAAYNSFVLYHNFRHVVDVLQALFYSLLRLGTLPEYPASNGASRKTPESAIARLLSPFDSLVLLVSAIGHDVGHPGVSNAFLVTLKSPLAQLYNDKSVLEAFHCAAYSQILRRHWRTVYEDVELRRLLINTILATDMGVHPEYMANLGNLQEKLHHDGGTDTWTAKLIQTNKDLVLGLLMKCADISNVARNFDTASQWAIILQQEFARQGEMEKDVGMSSTLFGGPPELGNMIKLANSQIGFMNFFGLPLFEGVADIMPELCFAVDEIIKNKSIWEERIEDEKQRRKRTSQLDQDRRHVEIAPSPRSASPARTHFTPVTAAGANDLLETSPEPYSETLQLHIRPNKSRLIDVTRTSLADGSDNFFTPPALPEASRRPARNTSHNLGTNNTIPQTSAPADTPKKGNFATNVSNGSLPMRQNPDRATQSDIHATDGFLRTGSQNFSRPYSQQQSSQPSCTTARSSASRAPTLSSTNLPPSPTKTQAASIEGNGSKIGSSAAHPDMTERPDVPIFESPMLEVSENSLSRDSPNSIAAIDQFRDADTDAKARPLTSDTTKKRSSRERQRKDDSANQIKRKSSRWKFDFWRRRRQGDKELHPLDGMEQGHAAGSS